MRTESTTHAHAPAYVMSRVAAPSASQARALLVGCTSLYLARARLASTATVDEGALTSLAMMLLAALGAMRRALRDADANARDSATSSYGALAGLAPVWALCAASARASGYSSSAATASARSAAGSVAYVDAWTPSSTKRAFASAVSWMVAMRPVTGTVARVRVGCRHRASTSSPAAIAFHGTRRHRARCLPASCDASPPRDDERATRARRHDGVERARRSERDSRVHVERRGDQ